MMCINKIEREVKKYTQRDEEAKGRRVKDKKTKMVQHASHTKIKTMKACLLLQTVRDLLYLGRLTFYL